MSDNQTPAIIDEHSIRDKIYILRGQQVMLDFDLAEIYGYETKAFNQQVKRNVEKFDEDFRFQLTKEEFNNLRSQNVTSNWGGARYLPWAFTESGIYMLMTVLKGNLAVNQSKALIRTFRAMKDYIVDSRALVSQTDQLRLSMQMTDLQQNVSDLKQELVSVRQETQRDMTSMRAQLDENTRQISEVLVHLDDTVRRSELPEVFLNPVEVKNQYLFLGGEPARADETFIRLYSLAKRTIHIIDDYINIKTLRLLQDVKSGVTVTVFSDNVGNKLHLSDVADFQTEFPNIPISFQVTARLVHDRFIALDYGTADERIFLCGTSSKDAAIQKITAISELTEEGVKSLFRLAMGQLQANPALGLR